MKILERLKRDNRGASLIAVVIAMVFVVSIGVIIMNITLTNISMKEIEVSSKKNFYSAEDVVETIRSSLTDSTTECMEKAYVTILGRYASNLKRANGVQSSFQAAYLDNLVVKYAKDLNNNDLVDGIEGNPSSSFELSNYISGMIFIINFNIR